MPGAALTLFPRSMSTTSCCAYSWISVSQACMGTTRGQQQPRRRRRMDVKQAGAAGRDSAAPCLRSCLFPCGCRT